MVSLAPRSWIRLIKCTFSVFGLAILILAPAAEVYGQEVEGEPAVVFVLVGLDDPPQSSPIFDLQGPQAQKPPPPAHTGFKALLFETANDFSLYPRRPSTWVILGIGGATALLVHPFDDDVNAKLVGSDAVERF